MADDSLVLEDFEVIAARLGLVAEEVDRLVPGQELQAVGLVPALYLAFDPTFGNTSKLICPPIEKCRP